MVRNWRQIMTLLVNNVFVQMSAAFCCDGGEAFLVVQDGQRSFYLYPDFNNIRLPDLHLFAAL